MKMLYEKYVEFYINLENCKKQEKRVWMILRKFFLLIQELFVFLLSNILFVHIIYDINE